MKEQDSDAVMRLNAKVVRVLRVLSVADLFGNDGHSAHTCPALA